MRKKFKCVYAVPEEACPGNCSLKAKLRTRAQTILFPHLTNFYYWSITHMKGGGAEYLIITKERIVLAFAPYAPHEGYFHQGQKHTIFAPMPLMRHVLTRL